METSFVALDNNGVLTVKLGREISLVSYSTDKRSNSKSRPLDKLSFTQPQYIFKFSYDVIMYNSMNRSSDHSSSTWNFQNPK